MNHEKKELAHNRWIDPRDWSLGLLLGQTIDLAIGRQQDSDLLRRRRRHAVLHKADDL